MNKKSISYQQFLEGYNAGELAVIVDRFKAGNFVLSEHADKKNKAAHLFWTWLGIIMVVPIPIVLIISHKWIFAICAFLLGLIITNAARKSAARFVLQNMLENENYWDYVLLHKGARIQDNEGNEVTSEFLDRMAKKFGEPDSRAGSGTPS